MTIIVTARQFDTLDLICWRNFGATRGVTEVALGLNPGVARLGELIPEGSQIVLPDSVPRRQIDMINLWN